MNGIEKIVDKMQQIIDKINVPTGIVPPTLLYCTAIKRSGGSPLKATADAINIGESLGLDFSKNEDGSDNLGIALLYAGIKAGYNMATKDMVGQGAELAGTSSVAGFTSSGEAFTGTNTKTSLVRVLFW